MQTLGEYKFQIKSYLRDLERQEGEVSFLPNCEKISMSDHFDKVNRQKNLHYSKDHSYQHEWKYFAIIIDRVVLLLFAIVTPLLLLLMYLRIVFID